MYVLMMMMTMTYIVMTDDSHHDGDDDDDLTSGSANAIGANERQREASAAHSAFASAIQ